MYKIEANVMQLINCTLLHAYSYTAAVSSYQAKPKTSYSLLTWWHYF